MVGEQAVIDLVDIREVVDAGGLRFGCVGACHLRELDGPAAGIVETDLVLKDGMKADGLEAGRLFHGAEIVAIALTQ